MAPDAAVSHGVGVISRVAMMTKAHLHRSHVISSLIPSASNVARTKPVTRVMESQCLRNTEPAREKENAVGYGKPGYPLPYITKIC